MSARVQAKRLGLESWNFICVIYTSNERFLRKKISENRKKNFWFWNFFPIFFRNNFRNFRIFFFEVCSNFLGIIFGIFLRFFFNKIIILTFPWEVRTWGLQVTNNPLHDHDLYWEWSRERHILVYRKKSRFCGPRGSLSKSQNQPFWHSRDCPRANFPVSNLGK